MAGWWLIGSMSTDRGVAARVAKAQQEARAGENEVDASSAQRLAVLKTWPPARLMRLGRDPDLTDADQRELQNFIANRANLIGRHWTDRLPRLRQFGSFRRLWGLRGIALSGTIVLIVVALGYSYMRTPTEYQLIARGGPVLIGNDKGPSEQVTFPPGTVILLGPPRLDGRSREISFWISGRGYRSAVYYAE